MFASSGRAAGSASPYPHSSPQQHGDGTRTDGAQPPSQQKSGLFLLSHTAWAARYAACHAVTETHHDDDPGFCCFPSATRANLARAASRCGLERINCTGESDRP